MGSDDDYDITPSEDDAMDTLFPAPKRYEPAPDVSVLSVLEF
jgi:hypothetical protein